MTLGDVHTRERDGVWDNVVEGELDLKWVFADAAQAVANGERVADTFGSAHVIESPENPEPSGVAVPPYVHGA